MGCFLSESMYTVADWITCKCVFINQVHLHVLERWQVRMWDIQNNIQIPQTSQPLFINCFKDLKVISYYRCKTSFIYPHNYTIFIFYRSKYVTFKIMKKTNYKFFCVIRLIERDVSNKNLRKKFSYTDCFNKIITQWCL